MHLKTSSEKYRPFCFDLRGLTHWGRVTHICVGKLTIIGSDNGLSPERRQAIMWTNAGILLIGSLGTNFNEILIEIQTFSLKKIRLKMSSAKCCSFRLGLNVLTVAMDVIYEAGPSSGLYVTQQRQEGPMALTRPCKHNVPTSKMPGVAATKFRFIKGPGIIHHKRTCRACHRPQGHS